MINKPYFPKYRVSELSQFLTDALSVCSKYNPVSLQIDQQVDKVKEQQQALSEVFNNASGSSISNELVELDQRRDDCITGIRLCAEGFSYYFDATLRQAGAAILKSISNYGNNIQRLNYQSETSTINSLIGDWQKSNDLTNALSVLNLTAWAEQLKVFNDQFNARYLARIEEGAAAPQNNATELKKPAIAAFRELSDNIDARALLSKDGSYDKLISELNLLTDKYNKLVDSRKGNTKITEAKITDATAV